MWQDLRFALRTLRKNRGASAVAILVLAVGIGANAIVFSLVDGFLLRPLEFHDPERLVRLFGTQENVGRDRQRLSEGAFFDLRERSEGFAELVGAFNTGLSVTDAERPLNPLMRRISRGYFELLGAGPALGRAFLPEEHVDGGRRVVILHHGFWQTQFGGDPNIVGKTIELGHEPYEVVGVMPETYRNPSFPQPPVLWLPMPENAAGDRRRSNLVVLARLADGVTVAQAQTELDRISSELAALHPDTDAGLGVRAMTLHASLVETLKPALLVLFGAVAFVLLIACGNVANLILARAVGRQQEIGVRLAMGAGKRQLARQLVIESLVLGLGGALLGLIFAFWSLGPLLALRPSNITIALLDQVRLDHNVVLFTLGVAVAMSVALGLAPLRQLYRDGTEMLAAGAARAVGGLRRRRLRGWLVVSEVALSLMLLIGAGLMLRTFLNLRALDLGFEPEGLLTMRTTARGSGIDTPARFAAFYDQVLEEIRALPGVEKVGACEIPPFFGGFGAAVGVRPEGQTPAPDGAQPQAILRRTSVDFFRAFELPILSGRGFTDRDRPDTEPVAVVSRSLARAVWGERDPLGERLAIDDGSGLSVRIVGVSGDLRGLAASPEPPPNLYLAYDQKPIQAMSLFIRTPGDPMSLAPAVEQAIWSVSRDAPVYVVTDMTQMIADVEWQPRFVMQLLIGFAILALVLASTGIYAVLAYAVAERTREIGIRVAFGADRGDVVRMVLGGSLKLAAIGVVIGFLGAFAASRFLASQLYGVAPTDPPTYLVLALILTGVALLASYLPARRASGVDPVIALRAE